MNPKLFVTLAVLVSLFCSSSPASVCADAYTSASYGLSHSKKAFKAYNFDHQKYYAGRALEALEKTRDLVGECGCTGALNSIEDGIENLEEALDPADWKMGRYYSKKAMENTYTILERLDMCSMDGESSDSTAKPEEEHQNKVDSEEAIRSFHLSAEEQLEQLKEKIIEIGQTLGCENSEYALEEVSIKTPDVADFSSLEEAMDFYKAQTLRAYEKAVTALQECNSEK